MAGRDAHERRTRRVAERPWYHSGLRPRCRALWLSRPHRRWPV